MQSVLSGSGTIYIPKAFIITSGNATEGATYTNNGITFTVNATSISSTVVYLNGNGNPTASGILTKTSGTGDATLTFSSVKTALYLKSRIVGAGGGGNGSGTSFTAGTSGSSGGTTTLGNLSATGGSGTSWISNYGGNGGTATITPPAYGTKLDGNYGAARSLPGFTASGWTLGGLGGNSIFGGASQGGIHGAVPPATANSGSGGGGGAAWAAGMYTGHGGGSGAYAEAITPFPPASMSFSIGIGGLGGISGAGGGAGCDGASGFAEYTVHF
jgi:hypothetical protein